MKHFRTTVIAALLLGAGTAQTHQGTTGRGDAVAIPSQALRVGSEIEVIRQGRTIRLSIERILRHEARVTIEACDELGEIETIEIDVS